MTHEENSLPKKSSYSRFLDSASEILGKIGGLATMLMVIVVTVNVVTRKLFSWPIPGFYEILGLIGAVFYGFGIVYAAIKGQHIIMSLLINHVPPTLRRVFNLISRAIIVVFCGLFAYAGASMAWTMWLGNERTDQLRIPVAPFRFIVVIALVMLGLLILGGKEIGKGGDE